MGAPLLLNSARELVSWLRARVRVDAQMSADSRKLKSGDVFLAYPGYAKDGREFVAAALASGAAACVVEAEGADHFDFDERTACVTNLKQLAGEIASLFYGEPSRKLDVIAVTGTNGKTTVTNWIAQGFEKIHIPCAVIGTLGMIYKGDSYDTGMTTPDPVLFQRFMNEVLGKGAKAVAVEASSIGIEEGRMNGTQIKAAVFTNLTQDHLDYHGDMQRYAKAKRKLFDWPGLEHAVIHVGDATGMQWAEELKSSGQVKLQTFKLSPQPSAADLTVSHIKTHEAGLSFTVSRAAQAIEVQPAFIGEHNVENFLAAVAVLEHYTLSFEQAVKACETVKSVNGRLELIHTSGAPLAVVDYAHTPDALEKALNALRSTAVYRKGKLAVLFGCGGDRDKTKRPLMACAAEQGADVVVVTSDNPRTENAEHIIQDIMAGLSKAPAMLEPDRRKAIHTTIGAAHKDDVVLIAGKGHEDYQIIGTIKHAFSDQAEARLAQQQYVISHAHAREAA